MSRIACIALFIVAAASIASAAEPMVIADFTEPGIMDRVNTLDSNVAIVDHDGGKALEVTFGTERPYPNARIQPDGPAWDISAHTRVEVDVTNLNDESTSIACRVDNPGATGRKNSLTSGLTLDPGQRGTIVVRIDRTYAEDLRQQMTGMDHTPWGKRGEHGGSIDPTHIVEINLFTGHPTRPRKFLVHSVRATGTFDPEDLKVPDPFFPFVDKFGQYMHADWEEKIHRVDDLAAAREAEARRLQDNPRPDSWNKYGGWADGPQLEATGHFRTEKHQGKWHLVDPEGRLFFSIGMDVVQGKGGTPVDEEFRADWFANPPWENEPALEDHLTMAKGWRGEYKDKEVPSYFFYSANLERKYGQDWRETWLDITPKRLMNWGFNTIGCWSDKELFADTTIPYTHWVHYWAKKLPWQRGTRNPVPDPFDEKFEENLRTRAENFTRGTIDDPYCIGYFVDNELSWGDETYLAEGVLQADGKDQPAKRALVAFLKDKYGKIDQLNSAWRMWNDNWDQLLGRTDRLPQTDEGKADLREFNRKIVRTYFRKVNGVLKEVAPNKLYLGCRFAENNPQVVEAAAEFTDVVSFNLYRRTIAAWQPPADIDKPIVVGEFHFGATDAGVFGPGLRSGENQADRARLFKQYVSGAATNPRIVGVHWFQLIDEPVSGRVGDGENHNIGFLTITDTPYVKMTEASRDVAREIYRLRAGQNAQHGVH